MPVDIFSSPCEMNMHFCPCWHSRGVHVHQHFTLLWHSISCMYITNSQDLCLIEWKHVLFAHTLGLELLICGCVLWWHTGLDIKLVGVFEWSEAVQLLFAHNCQWAQLLNIFIPIIHKTNETYDLEIQTYLNKSLILTE